MSPYKVPEIRTMHPEKYVHGLPFAFEKHMITLVAQE